jgi:hypothetical protein
MSKETTFTDNLIRSIKLSINTLAPAKIVKFNEAERTASIEVLFMTKNKDGTLDKLPMIENVPVVGQKFKEDGSVKVYTPYLEPNDIVFVGFCQRSLDNLGPNHFDPGMKRTHDMAYAIVLGGIF